MSKNKNKPFSLPDRAIEEFDWDALQEIQKYGGDNYAFIESVGDIDVAIGGYQKWLARNGFEIIDTKKP